MVSTEITSTISDRMPLKCRELDQAIDIVAKNVYVHSSHGTPLTIPAKSETQILMCSGAPGIGKTRYGLELYKALIKVQPDGSSALRSWLRKYYQFQYEARFHYLMIDFAANAKLREQELTLPASTILAFRMVYSFFVKKDYDHFLRVAMENDHLFTLNAVIDIIHKRLDPSGNDSVFLFLHLDECQKIISQFWVGPAQRNSLRSMSTQNILSPGLVPTEGGLRLFKEITYCLGELATIYSRRTFTQSFVSGTAQQDLLKQAEPTLYSFEMLPCPLLSYGACFEILSAFVSNWERTERIMRLITSTGGLPRALQFLLEAFFQSRNTYEFKGEIRTNQQEEWYFNVTAERLNKRYSVSVFVDNNPELVNHLIYRFLYAIPCSRNEAPLPAAPNLTFEVLQRDSHIILKKLDMSEKALVIIPNFFLFLYFRSLEHLSDTMMKYCLKNWDSEEFASFEQFVAEFEVFRTNLLISVGKSNMTVGDFYHKARGQRKTLERTVLLEQLAFDKVERRFPASSPSWNWANCRKNLMVLNAHGASFADSFVFRHSVANDKGIIFGFQTKLYDRTPLNISKVLDEHRKNKNAISGLGSDSPLVSAGIKSCDVITVIITTATLPDNIPDDCLVVCKKNFADFFGAPFALRASLSADKSNGPFSEDEFYAKLMKYEPDPADE